MHQSRDVLLAGSREFPCMCVLVYSPFLPTPRYYRRPADMDARNDESNLLRF
jgi:hypothetical protein